MSGADRICIEPGCGGRARLLRELADSPHLHEAIADLQRRDGLGWRVDETSVAHDELQQAIAERIRRLEDR